MSVRREQWCEGRGVLMLGEWYVCRCEESSEVDVRRECKVCMRGRDGI